MPGGRGLQGADGQASTAAVVQRGQGRRARVPTAFVARTGRHAVDTRDAGIGGLRRGGDEVPADPAADL